MKSPNCVSTDEVTQLEQFGVSTLSGVEAVFPAVSVFSFSYREAEPHSESLSYGEAEPLSEATLQTRVEVALRKAGIKVVDKATAEKMKMVHTVIGVLYVTVVTRAVSISVGKQSLTFYAVDVYVTFRQNVRLDRNPEILTQAPTWPYLRLPVPMMWASADRLEEYITETLDEDVADFINDYFAANPRTQTQK